MGLDLVEMVMALEDEFDIPLKDKDLQEMESTPRALIDHIHSKYNMIQEGKCGSQVAFHILRKAIIKVCNVERKDIKLDTEIRDFIPEKKARDHWLKLEKETKAMNWPELVRPVWVSRMIWSTSILVFSAILFNFKQDYRWITSIILDLLITGFWTAIIFKITTQLKTVIPGNYVVVGDLVPAVSPTLRHDWTREQIAEKAKEVIIKELDLKEEDYREDADFIKDLGAN